jgi:imidazolonepropionase
VVSPTGDFAIVNATVATLAQLSARAGGAATEGDLGIIPKAAIVARAGRIAAFGSHADCRVALAEARRNGPPDFVEYDAGGSLVLPGLIDAHTHALFAGDRVADFEAIAAGEKPTLGIRYTVEQTRRCSEGELVEVGKRRLALMADHGTTTAEVKSGYALTAPGESTMLRAMRVLDAQAGLPHVVATFCGAHALPPEFDDYEAFVDELCATILPAVAELGIARYADAFCEVGHFSVAQSRRFLQACAARGMRLRLHADELQHSGGSILAAELRCASADHLNFADAGDVARLAGAHCAAVLCPATTEYLGLPRYAPARDLIDAGVPVSLATDFNPGTSTCFSLQTVAHLARRRLHMTAPETVAALTVNPALSLGVAAEAGSIELGKRADLVVLASSDYREFGYYYGVNLVTLVTIGRPTTLFEIGDGAPRVF